MKNLKRALCLVLVCAMTLGLMIMTTSAADFTDKDEIVNTEAVDTMVALNIINGKDDGSYFDPTGIVTRAEMCKMICVALNGGKDPQLGTTSLSYTDTNGTWAAGYIEYCTNLGIVAGRGNGIFDPTGTVTGTEAAKMLLVAIGYDSENEGFTGVNWAVAVNVRANLKDLYDELEDMDPSAGLTRDNAAQMVYNAINATEVEYAYQITTVNGAVTTVATVKNKTYSVLGTDVEESILHEKFNMITIYGTMAGVTSYDSNKAKYTYRFTDCTNSAGDDITAPTLKSTVDYSGFFGMNVKIMYKDDTNKTVYGVYADGSKVLASGVLGDIGTFKADSVKLGSTVYKTDEDTTETPVYYFNEYDTDGWDDSTQYYLGASASTSAIPVADEPYTFKFVDNDDDGEVDCLVALPFSVAKVSYVGSTSFTIGTPAGGTVTGGSKTIDNVNVYDGIARNDYVMIVDAANTADRTETYSKIDLITAGKVSDTKSSGVEAKIDGTWYTVNDSYISGSVDTFEAGDELSKLVAVNGYVFFAEADSANSVDDWAVVTAISGITGVNDHPQAKLLLTDGTKTVVDLKTMADYPEGKGHAAATGADATIEVGELVAFEKDSDGLYYLTRANNFSAGNDSEDKLAFDEETYLATTVLGDTTGANQTNPATTGAADGDADGYEYSKNGKSTLASNYIADDAVIFYYNGSSYKVMTGDSLARVSESNVPETLAVYSDDSSSTGLSTVVMAYVQTTSTVSGASKSYGYVTATPTTSLNSDGVKVTSVTFWNGTETVSMLCDSEYSISKNDIIVYTVNSDGELDLDNNYAVKATTSDSSLGTVAISGYGNDVVKFAEDKKTTGTYSDGMTNAGPLSSNANFEITDDTVIFYIDVENAVGNPTGSISLADETAASTSSARIYFANAFYIESSSTAGDLDLLVVDVANDIANVN